MAERRMFAKTVIDSDAFLDMSLSSQALYFHLSMRADDDGFLNNPQKIMRMVGCNKNDLDMLIAKKFIITFEKGIIVIKHWKIHNYIRKDRYNETIYKEEKSMLVEKESGAYSLGDCSGIPLVNQPDTQRLPQVRLGKVRLGKVKKDIVEQDSTVYPISEIIAYLNAKAGTMFRPGTESTVKHIKARLDDGYVIDDFKAVIDDKCNDWLKDAKMKQYIRPSTLFIPTNFENYLNKAKANNAGGKFSGVDDLVT